MNIPTGYCREGYCSQPDCGIDLRAYEPEHITNDMAVFLGIHPEHLCIEEQPENFHLSTVTVDLTEPMGGERIFWFELLNDRRPIKVYGDHHYHTGDRINMFINPGKVHLFSQETKDKL
ncbi:hypothetical protein [Gynuella sp.]|uniref:hypothetical protein n=1 Tax=Gynuella sp. TaxID=2969146 RepID=UPI003D0D4788